MLMRTMVNQSHLITMTKIEAKILTQTKICQVQRRVRIKAWIQVTELDKNLEKATDDSNSKN